MFVVLCRQHAAASDLLDLFFGKPREELGLDDDWLLGQQSLTQHLVVAGLNDVDNWRLLLMFLEMDASVLRDERPHLVQVDGRPEFTVLVDVEVPHSDLPTTTCGK